MKKIIKKLISELHFNQWENTDSTLKWFFEISNNKDNSFIKLDIKEFYPSNQWRYFDKLHTTIDDNESPFNHAL